MLLAVDIGNTEVTLGVWQRGAWVARWRLRSVRNATPDEYALWTRGLFRDAGLSIEHVRRVVLDSVVPPLTDVFVEVVAKKMQRPLLVVRPGVRTGLRIRADNPAEVGADLVVNAVAAYQQFKTACIIISFGTATVFTGISAEGEFMGAAIAPGLRLAASALADRTAQLPGVQLAAPPAALGKNTIHAMQSGLVLGYVSMVEGMVQRFRRELDGQAPVIATGGLVGVIAPNTDVIDVVDPWLTLDGLRIVAERNPMK